MRRPRQSAASSDDQRIVAVEDRGPARPRPLEDFPLRPGDGPEVREEGQVDGQDVGDHGDIGRGDPDELPDLARRAHPHLQDGDLVVRLEPQQGQGQAETVVEVPLGLEHAITGGDEGRGEILGRCLARAAGDPDDFPRPGREDAARQGLEGQRHVGDPEQGEARSGGGHGPRDDGAGRSPGRRVGQELVTVAPTREGEEQRARPHAPGIDVVGVDDPAGVSGQDFSAGRGGDDVEAQGGHGQGSFMPAASSATTATSLNGTVRSLKTW